METLSAGERLAERYRIEDLVGEAQRSQVWRAVDDVLNRSVSVQVVPSDDQAADALLVAARRATAVEDPRFLRVLDAAHENGYAYVVREWASGVSLDTVLREGPLPAARSIGVVREVAEAVANAHRADVQHRRLDPSRILVKHNGAVRVLGLATDQAMYAPGDDVESASAAAEQADVTALGQLLYACLVARWPGERDLGLLMAPTEHGRLLRPRQVRAGVDPATDAICDRILGIGPRQAGHSLRSAAQVAHELAVLTTTDEPTRSFAPPADEEDRTIPRGVLPVAPSADGPPPALNHVPPPRATQPAPAQTGSSAPSPRRRTGARAPVRLAVALLVAISAAIGFLVLPEGNGDAGSDPASSGSTPGTPSPRLLDIVAIDDFDPLGSDGENQDSVGFAFDGDSSTAWTTVTYYSELQAQKEGVGLLVDLGRPQDVDSVNLQLVGGPTTAEVYAAPDETGTPPASVDRLDLLGESSSSATDVALSAESAIRTQYLVVWLTSLPEVEPGQWVGSVAEITVRG